MPRFEIRPALPADAAAMMEIRTSVRENVITAERLEELDINEASLVEKLVSSYSGFCAVDNGRVLGFGMGDRLSGEVWALFVRPEAEGNGLGSRLLEAVLEDLKEAGHTAATLVTEVETRAYGFYVDRGWKHDGYNHLGEARLLLPLAVVEDQP